jgi:alcohol dehydrogenase/propanol-preferring alcohol dehydrogenase
VPDTWTVGQRVGVGFLAGPCGACDACRHGNLVACERQVQTGVDVDGGYAEVLIAQASGLIAIPDELDAVEAAPLLCAGLTTFAALRKSGARAGDTVAVVGVGGLGHLAIQYAKAAGFPVTAVTRTPGKQELALQLGADRVVAGGAALKEAGGADVLLHTSSSHAAAVDAMTGLRPWGKVVVMGVATDQMALPAGPLAFQGHEVIGSAHNGMEYLVEALDFVARGAVRPMVDIFPKERVGEAYEAAGGGRARFKAVVTF